MSLILIPGLSVILVYNGYSVGVAVLLSWLSTGLVIPGLYLLHLKIDDLRPGDVPVAKKHPERRPVISSTGQ